MQQYCRYMLILLLLHKCLAQDDADQANDKSTKTVIKELIKKINEVSDQSLFNAPYTAKLEILRKIEAKLQTAAKSMGAKGERYVKLIMRGMKARALSENSSKNKTQVEVPPKTDKISQFVDKVNEFRNSEKTKHYQDKILINQILNRTSKNDLNLSNEIFEEENELNQHLRRMAGERSYKNNSTEETSTEQTVQNLTPRYECEESLDKVCLNIKQMKELKCHFDDSVVSIEKLCDEVTDCIDRTDEKFCTSQVTERIHNANDVLQQIEESFELDCYPNKTKDSVMTTQIVILRSVLQAQHEFVQKYRHFNTSLLPSSGSVKGEGAVKKAVNELSLIISSLAFALDAELCAPRVKTGEEFMARKFNDLLIEDFDKIMEEVKWTPKSCNCIRERCQNITTCTDICKRVCWQKYSLIRWSCPSINDTENVAINVICDGKFDCLDESDEKGCIAGTAIAKFDAQNTFKEILSSLSSKATSKEYEFIRNMLLSLRNTIEELQTSCTASEPDLEVIRAIRNKCFSALSAIYLEIVAKATYMYQKSEAYAFLISLNENLVTALKHSHTGNKRIVSNVGCYCTNGGCAMPICSRNCRRSCLAEPWLTRYICENSSNETVSLYDVCDGKPNCPKQEDENECEKEICRRHHLALLRQDIQKIGKKQKGTAMGELLTSWKIKVSSTIMVAEGDFRPNPNTIKDVIKDILNDLVTTFGAVKDYRRNNEYGLEEFINIARYIMKYLKMCSH